MAGSVWAIGDVQGCFGALQRLLEKIRWAPGGDRLWLCGDMVNRGPESLATLEFCRRYSDDVDVVLGNHDLHLLAVAESGRAPKRKDTLNDILNSPDRAALLEWLAAQPLIRYDESRQAVLVHAGILPHWSVSQALALAGEVEACLKGAGRVKFLGAMYGNQPDRWSPALEGMDRLRFIVNVMTRMRFIGAEGELDMQSKGPPQDAPKGFRPWFEFPRGDQTRIFFGHWAALMGRSDHPQRLALDTGCVWGESLTAMNVDTGERISVPARP